MRGKVVGLQARMDVALRLSNQPDLRIEFVIDTGFEGALTLPPAAIAALGLPYIGELRANLADDSSRKTDVYSATILWEGNEIEVAVLALGKRPLLGTALLGGHHFFADFVDGGEINIQARS